MTSDGLDRDHRRGLAALVTGIALFSTGPVLTAGSQTNGLVVGFWRIWLSGAVMFVFAAYRRKVDSSAFKLAAVPGIAFGVTTALFFTAVQITSVANATLISTLVPIPLLIVGSVFFSEKPRLREIAWVAIAILGASFMVLAAQSAETGDIKGDLLAAGSLLGMALYFASGKRARASLDTVPFMVGMWMWAGVAITPILLLSDNEVMPANGADWLRIAGIVAFAGTGHTLINYSHQHVSLAIIGVLHLFLPVGSGLLAWMFLDQSISQGQAVGMAIVIAALAAYTLEQGE